MPSYWRSSSSRRSGEDRPALGPCWSVSSSAPTLVFAQSAYRSWVYDFQGQGRYLFPILPMLFFYWRQCETASLRIPALVVTALLGTHALLSFALIGLATLA